MRCQILLPNTRLVSEGQGRELGLPSPGNECISPCGVSNGHVGSLDFHSHLVVMRCLPTLRCLRGGLVESQNFHQHPDIRRSLPTGVSGGDIRNSDEALVPTNQDGFSGSYWANPPSVMRSLFPTWQLTEAK